MLLKLDRVKSKKNPLLAQILNTFAEKIEQAFNREYRSGPNVFVRSDADSVHIEAQDQSGAPPSTTVYQPFEMISFSPVGGDTTGDSGYYLTLQPGFINGSIFPKVSGTYMWQQVATTVDGVTTYAYPTLTVNKGDIVYISADIAAGQITDANIYAGMLPDDTDETASYTLGVCDSTGAWTQLFYGDLAYTAAAAYFSAGLRLIVHQWN